MVFPSLGLLGHGRRDQPPFGDRPRHGRLDLPNRLRHVPRDARPDDGVRGLGTLPHPLSGTEHPRSRGPPPRDPRRDQRDHPLGFGRMVRAAHDPPGALGPGDRPGAHGRDREGLRRVGGHPPGALHVPPEPEAPRVVRQVRLLAKIPHADLSRATSRSPVGRHFRRLRPASIPTSRRPTGRRSSRRSGSWGGRCTPASI